MTDRTKTRRKADRPRHQDAAAGPVVRRLLTFDQATGGSKELMQMMLEGIETGELEVYDLDGGRRVDEVEFETFLSSRKPGDEPTIRSARKRKHRDRSADRHLARRPLELLTVEEAARYAKVSVQTVRRWLKSGKLKFYRAGRQIRVDLNDLVEFLSQ